MGSDSYNNLMGFALELLLGGLKFHRQDALYVPA
jgi:hypothetical protein